jgi:hypothetical protein
MAKIECTDSQLILIQKALDFYSRIGIGQFKEIKDHPTFEKHLYEVCTPEKTPEVGDRTPQGEILEIKDGKALINGSVKNGMWNKQKEWKKLKDVKLSTDYSKYHEIRDEVDKQLNIARNMLYNESIYSVNGGWGINNSKVDNSCREAFEIVKKIRYKFWLANPNKSNATVDSTDGNINFKIELDE